MPDKKWFDELTDRITRLLPEAGALGDELRTSLRQLLQTSLASLNVLTREEFDAQAQALRRAEQRIAELEIELTRLEALIESQQS
ncbi:MAG: accessory factor UbiK family protein [Pseudohongiellaceae bacterium]